MYIKILELLTSDPASTKGTSDPQYQNTSSFETALYEEMDPSQMYDKIKIGKLKIVRHCLRITPWLCKEVLIFNILKIMAELG